MKTSTIRNWYNWGGVEIAKIGTTEFLAQCASAVAFIELGANAYTEYATDNRSRNVNFKVNIDNGATASCNPQSRIVNLGIGYAMGNTFELMGYNVDSKNSNFKLIGMINGSMIHEGLHLSYTKPITDYQVKNLQAQFGNDFELLMNLYNIVEDIYIERRAEKLASTYDANQGLHWIQYKNDMMFSRERLDNEIESVGDDLDLQKLLSLIAFSKNARLSRVKAYRELLGKEILDILAGVRTRAGNVNPINRMHEAIELYRAINNKLNRQPNQSQQSQNDQTQQQQSGMSGDDAQTNEQGQSDASQDEQGETEQSEPTDPNDTGDQFSDEEITDDELEAAARMLSHFVRNELSGKSDEQKTNIQSSAGVAKVSTIVGDTDRGLNRNVQSGFTWDIPFDKNFVRELQYLNESHNVPSLLRNRGNRMHKAALHRIATTGKIFNNYSEKEAPARREAIIAIDASSSTQGRVFGAEIASARKMAEAMRKARLPHMVIAFTSSWGAVRQSVYIVSSFEMGPKLEGTEDDRWNALRTMRQATTPTASAIKTAREKLFTKKGGEKYLFVLSDGRPDSEMSTRKEIELSRDADIAVFSFSVVPDVVKYNDELFGESYNVDASTNAVQHLSKVLRNLLRGMSH